MTKAAYRCIWSKPVREIRPSARGRNGSRRAEIRRPRRPCRPSRKDPGPTHPEQIRLGVGNHLCTLHLASQHVRRKHSHEIEERQGVRWRHPHGTQVFHPTNILNRVTRIIGTRVVLARIPMVFVTEAQDAGRLEVAVLRRWQPERQQQQRHDSISAQLHWGLRRRAESQRQIQFSDLGDANTTRQRANLKYAP